MNWLVLENQGIECLGNSSEVIFICVCVCHVDVNVVCVYNVETLERKECWCVGRQGMAAPVKTSLLRRESRWNDLIHTCIYCIAAATLFT